MWAYMQLVKAKFQEILSTFLINAPSGGKKMGLAEVARCIKQYTYYTRRSQSLAKPGSHFLIFLKFTFTVFHP